MRFKLWCLFVSLQTNQHGNEMHLINFYAHTDLKYTNTVPNTLITKVGCSKCQIYEKKLTTTGRFLQAIKYFILSFCHQNDILNHESPETPKWFRLIQVQYEVWNLAESIIPSLKLTTSRL